MLTPLLFVLLALETACFADDLEKAAKTIRAADLQKHQVVLASDEYEGREAGSDGGHKAALYIVEQLQRSGLEPGGDDGTWFQPFGEGGTFESLEESNALRVFRDAAMKSSDVFRLKQGMAPLAISRAGTATGPIVFAGYGITAPEYGYDDYQGQKVKDAIVLVLDHEPQEKDAASRWNGDKPTKYSEWSHKIETAQKNGAAALLIVLDPLHHSGRGLPAEPGLSWPPENRNGTAAIPVAYLSLDAAETIAKAAGKDLKKLQQEIDQSGKPKGFRLARPAKLSVAYRGQPGRGQKNIVAVRRGKDPKLASEVVVVGAHYDHVGYGRFGSNSGRAGQIHNGADDNASGTCVLLEIAEALAGLQPMRTIALIWFDGEEKGLLGSKEWVRRPTIPGATIVSMLNLDMVGRNDLRDVKVGIEETPQGPKYPRFAAVLREAERQFRVSFDWRYMDNQKLLQRSDQWSFMEAGVPAAFFTGGLHGDYHTERDDWDRINYPKEELIGRIVLWTAYRIAGLDGAVR